MPEPLSRIKPYTHLLTRVDEKQLDALFESTSEKSAMTTPTGPSTDATISIDEFSKVDLRIAKIVKAEHVEVCAGAYVEREDALLPLESQLWNLLKGLDVCRDLLGTDVRVYGRKRSGGQRR